MQRIGPQDYLWRTPFCHILSQSWPTVYNMRPTLWALGFTVYVCTEQEPRAVNTEREATSHARVTLSTIPVCPRSVFAIIYAFTCCRVHRTRAKGRNLNTEREATGHARVTLSTIPVCLRSAFTIICALACQPPQKHFGACGGPNFMDNKKDQKSYISYIQKYSK